MTLPVPRETVTAALAEPVADDVRVSFPERRITGTVVRYGVPANTSAGRIIVYPGDVTWSAPERVAFLREHNRTGPVLGRAVDITDLPDRIDATFTVHPGPDGDRALLEAASGIRTGLSFGLDITANLGRIGDATRVAGLMRETSHVVVPAWDDSRITATASLGGSVTLPAPAPQAPAPAPVPAPAPAGSWQWSPAPPAAPPVPVFPQAPPAAYPVGGTQSPADHLTASLRDAFSQLADELRRGITPSVAAPFAPPPPAIDPAAPPPATPADGGAQRELGLTAFASLVSQVATGHGNAYELQAALSDIIPSDSPSAFRPQYLNELWEGTTTPRKFIDNATTGRPLTSMKVIGQRWEVAPEVGDYAGEKTPVPSNEPRLVDIPVTAKRIAGAHDVDRAYVDLGDPAWFASYFEAQAESYRVKSDRAASLQVWTDTVKLTGAVPTLLEGVIGVVVELSGLGKDVEYVAMAPGLVAALFGISNQEAPAFFGGGFSLAGGGDGALGNLKWFTTPGLGASQVLVGQKAATRYHEVAPPIRIQAVNVAQGGVDLGVFGYHAEYIRDHGAVRGFTVGQS